MIDQIVFERYLDQLADEIQADPPRIDALPADSWISRSAMQKAIRRGETCLALSAARQLFLTDRRALWRRLTVTALEDLGPTEFDTLGMIVSTWRSPKERSQLGEWRVIALLVERCCERSRNQSANDLHTVISHAPLAAWEAWLDHDQSDHAEQAVNARLDLQARAASALALMGAGPLGCDQHRFSHGALFAALAAVSPEIAAICGEAFRLTREPLAGLYALLPTTEAVQVIARPHPLPSVSWIGPVPGYVLDQYTRPGRAAIRRYAHTSGEWRQLAARHGLSRTTSTDVAGEILFRVEGAVITNWAATQTARNLSETAGAIGCDLPSETVPEARALLRRQLPYIDQMRRVTFTP